jgi:hypothetical protein
MVVLAVPGIGTVGAGVPRAGPEGLVPVVVHPAINILTISTTAGIDKR